MTLRKLGVLDEKEIALRVSQLEGYANHLERDVSSYARGRKRFWLQHEWDLKNKNFKPALRAPEIWEFCKQWMPDANLGLAVYGSVGITPHRDDSYADWRAVGINLGEVEGWQYDCQYPELYWTKEQNPSNPRICRVPVGGIFEFNCKNPHAAIGPAEDRWGIFLWKLKREIKKSHKYKEYIRENR